MDAKPTCEVPRLPHRLHDGHKGTYGTVLVVAGSRGMSGAAVLVGRSALRSGAGLVRVACPTAIQDVVAASHPCYTTLGIRQNVDGLFGDGAAEEVIEHGRTASAVAIGPGLGQGAGVAGFVRAVVAGLPNTTIVLDADGLNAIAPFEASFPDRTAPLVITPHPGEFARLLGRSIQEVQTQREKLAIEFAGQAQVVLLLKGSATLVTDGTRLYRNTTGNPGMATGGSGDVLTGTIAALIGQGLAGFEAAVLGAWAHGRAGDLALTSTGQAGLIATDLLDYLPSALREAESR